MNWTRVIKEIYLQIFFTFIAFFMMVVVSYFFVSGIVRGQLDRGVEDNLRVTEANIKNGLSKAELMLNTLVYAVQNMLNAGETTDAIQKYLSESTSRMKQIDDDMIGIVGAKAFIRGEFIDGLASDSGENFRPEVMPWYLAAARSARDATAYTPPYFDNNETKRLIISAVKKIYSESDEYYGMLSIEIDVNQFGNFVKSLLVTEGSYCVLTTQYMIVLAHPEKEFVGRKLSDIGGYENVIPILREHKDISSTRVNGNNDARFLLSFRRMYNGWYLGVVYPFNTFFRDVYNTAVILSLLGFFFMLCLCFILLRLNTARIRSDEANVSKSSFLATMSHEIRTPLNAILGLSEIQLQKTLSADALEYVEKIYTSASSLHGIINDVLDISKIEAGGFEMVSADFDVAALINDAAQLNIVRIGSKNIAFELEIDETMPSRLRGDDLRIKQILNNLLSNAFKYTNEGKVSFSAIWRPEGAYAAVTFTVSDTGMGIKTSDMSKLFTNYSQLSSNANRNIEGTGLGLAITKRLVGLMRGTIEAESEYGKGSVFRVELALEITLGTPIGEKTVDNLKRLRFMENNLSRGKNLVRTYMPYERVLIVDDVTTNLDVAKGLLIPYGLSIDCASSGREAIEKIRSISDGAPASEKYDIVFMDHMMPEMDGIETTRVIRGEIGTEYARTVPIIALTANAISGNEDMFLAAGFNGFIPKPIDIMALDAALNKWVREKQSEGAESETAMKKRLVFSMDGKPPTDLAGRRLEGVDFAEGTRRYSGESAYLQILRSYAANTPKLLRRIQNPSPEDMRDYAVAVHGLKGASLGIFANALA
ncbi:MAG: response regulator, partial [Synergistaceae bacterium]|nr:response regulator [Synergistaceae bacterium]